MGKAPDSGVSAGLVDVVRCFLLAHRALRRLAARFREGKLGFDEVQELVGDTDESLLFRLKERCHALFRQTDPGSPVGREALFDLAVGALFHEAMKLREGVYQQTVYGPKVRALRAAADPASDPFFGAFESMLSAGAERLEETLEEVETLLYQTRGELHALLCAHREDGRVARFLVEQGELVEEVFGRPIDAVLAEVQGSAAAAWERAARSYLESGFFAEAGRTLREARRREERPALARLEGYAEGMGAFLEGRFPESVAALARWADSDPSSGEERLAELAADALSKVGELCEAGRGDPVASSAAALAVRLRARAGASPGPKG